MSLTEKEVLSLLAVGVPGASLFSDIDVGLAKPVPVRGATVNEYIGGLVRRFPSVRQQFVMGPRILAQMNEAKRDAKAAADAEGRAFDEQAFQDSYEPDASDFSPIDARIDNGPEADGALIAICIGHPGNREIEKKVVGLPGDVFDRLLSASQFATWGEEPDRFFRAVTLRLMGMTMKQVEAAMVDEAVESDEAASSS